MTAVVKSRSGRWPRLFPRICSRDFERLLVESGAVGEIRAGQSVPGAGSVPGAAVPSPVLVVHTPSADLVWDRLLMSDLPVIARRETGELIIDAVHGFRPHLDDALIVALRAACRS